METDYQSPIFDYSKYLRELTDKDYNFVAPSSAFNNSNKPQNIFTGLESSGYNIMNQYYSQQNMEQTLKEGFDATVSYYKKQAELARWTVESQIQQALDQSLISNEVARRTSADIAKQEGGTLGTGAKQTMLDSIDKQFRQQATEVTTTAREKLLEAWQSIDKDVAEILQLDAKKYTEFIQTANQFSADLMENLITKNWLGFDLSAWEKDGVLTDDWSVIAASLGLGTLDNGIFELNDFGTELIGSALLSRTDTDGLGAIAKKWVEDSDYAEWYKNNSKFYQKELLGLSKDIYVAEDLAELYKQSGYSAQTISTTKDVETGRQKIKNGNEYVQRIADQVKNVHKAAAGGNAVTIRNTDLNKIGINTNNYLDIKEGSRINLNIHDVSDDQLRALGLEKRDIKQARSTNKLTLFYAGDGMFVHVESIEADADDAYNRRVGLTRVNSSSNSIGAPIRSSGRTIDDAIAARGKYKDKAQYVYEYTIGNKTYYVATDIYSAMNDTMDFQGYKLKRVR